MNAQELREMGKEELDRHMGDRREELLRLRFKPRSAWPKTRCECARFGEKSPASRQSRMRRALGLNQPAS